MSGKFSKNLAAVTDAFILEQKAKTVQENQASREATIINKKDD